MRTISSLLFGAMFGLVLVLGLAAFAQDDDFSFFDDEEGSPAAETPAGDAPTDEPASAEDTPADTKPAKNGSFLSGFLSRFEKNDDGKSDYRTPIETVLPRGTLMLAASAPVNTLNENLSELLKGLGLGKLSPADWIRLSAFGGAFKFVDQTRRLGVCWVNIGKESPPTAVLFIPIRRYLPFVSGLGADVSAYESDGAVPAGTLFPLKKPQGWLAFQKNGYACLLKCAETPDVGRLLNSPAVGSSFYGGPGLKGADLRLLVTPYGIRHFLELTTSADSAILQILPEILSQIKESNPDFDVTVDDALPHLDSVSDWVAENLRQLVLELKLASGDLLASLSLIPENDTELARQVQNRGGPDIPTLLDQPEFLKVLPEQNAPISGQTDLFPEFASKLEPPFDRLRHIEYSLGVPRDGQLLAETWAFFLEVDDSDAFVHELIVPKARLVGGHIGAEKIGDIAGQILGNLSMQRRANGRRPLFFSTPQEAASAGAGIGEQLGKQIGSKVGEDQALKKYEFEGFPLYVSDMKTYIQEMRKIREEETGGRERPVPQPLLSRRASFQRMLTTLLSGLETGSIDGLIGNQVAAHGGNPDSSPLPTEENLILVLDRTHILIVPGNRDLLSAALARWRDFVDRRGAGTDNDSPWRKRRDILYGAMSGGETQILRSAAQFDLSAVQAEVKYLQQYYGLEIPPLIKKPVPADLPEPLFVGTNSPGADLLYGVFPKEFLKFLLENKQKSADDGNQQH